MEKGKVTVKRVSLVSLILSMLFTMLFGNLASVYADDSAPVRKKDPNVVTVSLESTEHGSVKFKNSDKTTLDFKKGDTVDLELTPEDGYNITQIVTANKKGQMKKYAVFDGKSHFTVTEDVSVLTGFYNTLGVDAKLTGPKEVKNDNSVQMQEEYILKHMNTKYVGKGDKLTPFDGIPVTTTIADSTKFDGNDLDALRGHESEAIVGIEKLKVMLYEVDKNSDYTVAYVGANIDGAKLTDYILGENNDFAHLIKDYKYDEKTGLLYLPKKYSYKNADMKKDRVLLATRFQLLYAINGRNATNNVKVSVNAKGFSKKAIVKQDVSLLVGEYKIFTDDEVKQINADDIKSIEVNGFTYEKDTDAWHYDADMGILTIYEPPIAIKDLKVNVDKKLTSTLKAKVLNTIMPQKANAYGKNSSVALLSKDYVTFKGRKPKEGDVFVLNAENYVASSTYTKGLEGAWSERDKALYEQVTGVRDVYFDKLNKTGAYYTRQATIGKQTKKSWNHPEVTMVVKYPFVLRLICSHVGVDTNFNLNSSAKSTGGRHDFHGVYLRVAKPIDKNTVLGGFVNPTNGAQAGCGFYAIEIGGRDYDGDPFSILVQKAMFDFTDAGEPEGDTPDLKGIRFKVEHFEGYYNSAREAEASGKPTQSAVFETDKNGELRFSKAKPVEGVWNHKDDNMHNMVPDGTCVVTELNAPEGCIITGDGGSVFHVITDDNGKIHLKSVAGFSKHNTVAKAKGRAFPNNIMKGGVMVVKADYDFKASEDQGDASLAGVKYEIINKSENKIKYKGKIYQPGEVIDTIVTAWDKSENAYVATTGNNELPYGSYHIKEVVPSEGYLNAKWEQDFQIRSNNQMVRYDKPNSPWNENKVMRGSLKIGKIDRENKQYIPLGDAHLDGAVFNIINRSKHKVYVNGQTYGVGEVCYTMSTVKTKDGKYVASTPDYCLPYGTYELREVKSPIGYLFDKRSREWMKEFKIRHDGQLVDFTDEKDACDNQVKREDWSFKKKDEDSMERMDKVAFLVTSMTTGEKHVIVTDENGTWGSSWNPHTNQTNANDPDSPITNGAIVIDENGNYNVRDTRILNPEAGCWFTGMRPELTKWAADGKSYNVNGVQVPVNDKLRSFPYDTYRVEELRSDTNEGHALVTFTVTMKKYTADHDGPGIDLDYGTIDDKIIDLRTELMYGAHGKVMPAAKDVKIKDRVSYEQLQPKKKYELKEELHLVTMDGEDEGVIATYKGEFVPKKKYGYVDAKFTIDSTKFGGKKLVAYSYIYENGKLTAKHEDIDSEDQTVLVPNIGTSVEGVVEREGNAKAKDIVIKDTVKYTNLEEGKNYKLTGTLMDKETKKPLLDKDGKEITAETTFVATEKDGEAIVTFTFPSEKVDVEGKTIVAFEKVDNEGTTFAVHTDINDVEQTVTFPKVKTTALDPVDKDHETFAGEKQKIVDVVKLTNLVKDKTYKLEAKLQIKDLDGNNLGTYKDADGKELVVTKEFKAEKSDMEVSMEFEVDARKLAGKDLVAFEKLTRDGKIIGLHADLTDEDQTIHIPEIKTSLATVDGLKEGSVKYIKDAPGAWDDDIYKIIKDKKEASEEGDNDENVEVGDKTDKNDKADKAKDSDKKAPAKTKKTPAKPVTRSAKMSADIADKKLTIEDATKNTKATKVEAKNAETEDNQKAEATDENAEEASGKENADNAENTDAEGDSNVVVKPVEGLDKEKMIELIDTISYKNLTVGKEYHLKAALHLKIVDAQGRVLDGGILKDEDGKPVVSEVKFTPEEKNGEVDVPYYFNASKLAGNDVVSYAYLYNKEQKVAEHVDIEDMNQTFHFVQIHTDAVDAQTETKQMLEAEEVTIDDTVAYKNLTPGTEYTMHGKLHVQKVDSKGNITDAGVLKDIDGKEVEASVQFTPENTDGAVLVPFTFKVAPGTLDGKTVVAFEDLSKEDVRLTTHSDIEDEGQSVHKAKVSTLLTGSDKKSKDVKVGEKIEVVDTISYENLVEGEKYIIRDILVDKDGQPLKDGDKLVEATAEFTAKKASGEESVKYTVDTSKMKDGDKLIAYAFIYDENDNLIGKHQDLEDANQTITVKEESKTPPTHVDLKTGVDNYGMYVAFGAIALVAALTGYLLYKKRNRA